MKRFSRAEATVLDFAFSIHTQVGLRFESALVDNQPTDGQRVLKSGNVVEIKMAKSYTKLDEQWLTRVTKRRLRKRIQSVLTLQGEGVLRAEAKIIRGNALSSRARYSDASENYNEAVLMKPELTWGLNRYAQSLRIAGKDELAREVHEAALERDEKNAFAACGLGLIDYVRGNGSESERWFRKALELNRDYVNAMFGLARICLALGRAPEADIWLDKAEKVQPGLARIALFRSLARAQLAKTSEAKLTLEICLRTFDGRRRRRVPEGSHGLYYYAFALLLGNSDNYKTRLAEALSVCPAIGVRREIEVDSRCVNPTAFGIVDAFALPKPDFASKPDSAGKLDCYVKWIRQGSVE
jgi:tetratricopeptide (TPR) repeat protein